MTPHHRTSLSLLQTLLLTVSPQGGQRRARQNARTALAAHAGSARTGGAAAQAVTAAR